MKAYIVRPTKYNKSDDHRFIVMAETELDVFRILHEMGEKSPRLYEFYEVKKEGMGVKLNYDHFSESDWDNKESISWKQPTTYNQSEMLSSFFNMENSYPWLGFSDKIEYEAYNNLED